MFERELVDTLTIQRWGIVRTVKPQSIAEHMYLVSHYANDICIFLNLHTELHLACLQYALWHDVDEIFSGDAPGPNKRGLMEAMGPGAREAWDAKLDVWTNMVFNNHKTRSGHVDIGWRGLLKLVIKTADWLEASVRMATEHQFGNACAWRHIEPNKVAAVETAKKLCDLLATQRLDVDANNLFERLKHQIETCVAMATVGQSRSPWITGEDTTRSGVVC